MTWWLNETKQNALMDHISSLWNAIWGFIAYGASLPGDWRLDRNDSVICLLSWHIAR